MMPQHVVLPPPPLQLKGLWFEFELEFLYVLSFASSFHAHMGIFWVLWFSPTTVKHAARHIGSVCVAQHWQCRPCQ